MTVPNPDASPRRVETRERTDGPGRRTLRGLVQGVVGGLIATALMTMYRFPVFRALPPTAEFWAKFVGGGDAESYFGIGLALHFMYGGAAGGVFGAGLSRIDFRSARQRDLGAIGLSLAYGLALSLFGTRVIFRHLLKEDLEPAEAVIFHVGHAIYGLSLGTWMNSRERSGEVYE